MHRAASLPSGWLRCFCCNGVERGGHRFDVLSDGCAEPVALCEPMWIIVGQPYRAGRILKHQRLQWQVDADRRVGLHERRTGFGAAEDQELGWSQWQTDFCGSGGMIDARKDGHTLCLDLRL